MKSPWKKFLLPIPSRAFLKVILVGETGTGKTSLINTATGQKFNEGEMTTSSATFVTKERKKYLKDQLTSIIKDSLLFAKKNSLVSAMLPPEVNEFFENMKNEENDNSDLFINGYKYFFN